MLSVTRATRTIYPSRIEARRTGPLYSARMAEQCSSSDFIAAETDERHSEILAEDHPAIDTDCLLNMEACFKAFDKDR